ncbi:MAG TPA: hypothetical protein VGK74_14945 [Symbiobacteriaceae bacterium]|jgi:hypothetical protein
MRRRRVIVAMLAVMLVLVISDGASASEGQTYLRKTWTWGDSETGAYGFRVGLSATQAKEIIDQMDTVGLGASSAAGAAQIIEALGAFGPTAAAVSVAVGLGDLALRKCSASGTRGIEISGMSWMEHKAFVENYDPDAPDITYMYRIYIPYWCKAQE